MFNLSPETKLDIFKCLSFNQLLSMRQTIRHFNALFIEYENELARTQCKKTLYYNSMTQNVFFKIPSSPKNIRQLLIIRYWLERLFNFVFEKAKFNKIMFSHRFIKLLFFDYTNPLQFKIKNAFLKYYKPTEGMKFVLNNLAIYESFNITFI
uniref:F-box domain-containing protein n=1 Tax=Meloidogyne hapla TaxID=6305 RepID=A0A1I8B1M9_MELHA